LKNASQMNELNGGMRVVDALDTRTAERSRRREKRDKGSAARRKANNQRTRFSFPLPAVVRCPPFFRLPANNSPRDWTPRLVRYFIPTFPTAPSVVGQTSRRVVGETQFGRGDCAGTGHRTLFTSDSCLARLGPRRLGCVALASLLATEREAHGRLGRGFGEAKRNSCNVTTAHTKEAHKWSVPG
jgi:hypothetical protein